MKKYSKKHIGKEFVTNGGYIARVIDGGTKPSYCTIQIGGWVSEVQFSHMKRGVVKYPYHKVICGKGYYGEGKYKAKIKNKNTKVYDVWVNMLKRCYCSKSRMKNPTYADCSVAEKWHNFQIFAEWFSKNYTNGWELDKDLLVSGNKVYSEENCVFIPKVLNGFIANNLSVNTSGQTGVNFHKPSGKWLSRIRDMDISKSIHLGIFEDIHQASLAYQRARTTMAHRLKHKMILEHGITDLRILDAIDKL